MSASRRETRETTEQEQVRTETLDPLSQAGLDLLQTRAAGLADTPLVAPLSEQTLSAIGTVGTGLGGIDPAALEALRAGATDQFVAGEFAEGEFTPGAEFAPGEFVPGADFVPGSRGALEALTSFLGTEAAGQVSDVFTAAGRTGSPAQAAGISEAVARAISPAVFGFEQSERARQDALQARETGRRDVFESRETARRDELLARETGRLDVFQDRETGRRDIFQRQQEARQDNALARQITSALGLQEVTSAADAARFQGELAQLQAAGIIDEQARREAEEPFVRLGLISGPILGAAGLGPSTVVQAGTGATRGSETSLSLNII